MTRIERSKLRSKQMNTVQPTYHMTHSPVITLGQETTFLYLHQLLLQLKYQILSKMIRMYWAPQPVTLNANLKGTWMTSMVKIIPARDQPPSVHHSQTPGRLSPKAPPRRMMTGGTTRICAEWGTL
ncbi:hypothetical protein J6590_020727 [Homalodisca vitripennis]|nr:hypothetical protein J6590_020727 [Homalodisca vitripennis]